MNQIITINGLVQSNGKQAVTTSKVIAEKFKKRHDNVLRDIANLECSKEFQLLNFEELFNETKVNNGAIRKMPVYNITRDGFMFLVMGFTGKEAARWKEKFITAFNAMEREIIRLHVQSKDAYWQQVRQEGKCIRLALTDVIQEFVSYAKKQGSQNAHKYYMNITKMEYKALEFVKQSGSSNFRDTLDSLQNSQLMVIEHAARQAIHEGMTEGLYYKDIFQKAKQDCLALATPLLKYTGREFQDILAA